MTFINMIEDNQGRKLIKPSKIKGVQASFQAFLDTLPKKNERNLIEAPVTANFETATQKVIAAMQSLEETVQSLDIYLNSVADTFVDMDESIASGINSSINQSVGGSSVKPFGERSIYTEPPKEHSSQNNVSNKTSKYLDVLPGR